MARNKFDIDETLETPFNIKHFKRAGKYVVRYKWQMILAFAVSLISSLTGLFVVTITGKIIDEAIPSGKISEVLKYGGIMMLCIAVSIISAVIRMRVMAKVSQHIISDIRVDLYAHLQKLSFSYYDTRPHGKILVRVIHYVNGVADVLSNGIVNVVLEILNMLIITVFMLTENVSLSLIAFAGVPFVLFIGFVLRPAQSRAWRSISNKSSNLTAFYNENLNGVRVSQLFAREEVNCGICERLVMDYQRVWYGGVRCNETIGATFELVSTVVTCLIYAGGVLWIHPAITAGSLVTMTGYVGRFWQPILSLANIYNSLVNAVAYLERIFETMDEPVEIADAPDAEPLPPISGALEFKDVDFSYEKGVRILKNVSFRVEPGQSVALVGPTGSGKTTIVNLISRFYDVDRGEILLDGHDISRVQLRSLRSQMGVMMQDSFIFRGTVADNIRYGKLDATDEQVRKAAAIVQADSFIEQMPQGYDTEIMERGSGLSQGQKQLIAFARTIVSDPKILILDEATSSIDTKTERLLQEGIQKMLVGRTSFIIAHRLSTIQSCDLIMYIDHGRIVEAGNHEQLMARQGAYWRLVTTGRESEEATV